MQTRITLFLLIQEKFGVRAIRNNTHEEMAALYLQVSIVSQALIFVTRSRSWSFVERPGMLLMTAFLIAQLVRAFTLHFSLKTSCLVDCLMRMDSQEISISWELRRSQRFWCFQVATLIAVYANWGFARIKGMGWGWAGVVWLYSIIFYIPLDVLKFATRYILSGKAWVNMIENKVCVSFV